MRAAGKLYDQIARFYDAGMEGFADDLPFYLDFARRIGGPVLEFGCGTGRVSIALAEAGYDVTGVDCSPEMLAIARRRLRSRRELPLRLVLADMREVYFRRRFRLVIIALDTFLHLRDVQEQRRTLKAARDNLEKDGVLLLDLAGPMAWDDWAQGTRPLVPVWSTLGSDGVRTSKYSTYVADASRQTRHVTEIYEQIDREALVRRWVAEYDLRYVFPAEADLLVDACRLVVHGRFGDYDCSQFLGDSPRLLLVLKHVPGLGSVQALAEG